jgi:multidrug resistance efflux pump
MNALFQPNNGQSVRQVCVDAVRQCQPEDIIPYEKIEALCGCDRHTAQAAMLYAKKDLERAGDYTVRAVRNIGWEVLTAEQAVFEVKHRTKKADRGASRRDRLVVSTLSRRDELSQLSRAQLDRDAEIARRQAELRGRRQLDTRALLDGLKSEPKLRPRREG